MAEPSFSTYKRVSLTVLSLATLTRHSDQTNGNYSWYTYLPSGILFCFHQLIHYHSCSLWREETQRHLRSSFMWMWQTVCRVPSLLTMPGIFIFCLYFSFNSYNIFWILNRVNIRPPARQTLSGVSAECRILRICNIRFFVYHIIRIDWKDGMKFNA